MTSGPAVRRPYLRLATTTAILGAALAVLMMRTHRRPVPPPNDRPGRAATVDREEAVERLKAVGYSAWSEAGAGTPNESGVVHYEPERSYGGYNLYTDYTDAA